MEPVVVTLIVFGSVGFVIWTWLQGRHKERIALIEKGADPATFKNVQMRELFRPNPLSSLKWGLLACFVGIGIIVGDSLNEFYDFSDGAIPASMLIFGGLGLVLFYLIASKKMRNDS